MKKKFFLKGSWQNEFEEVTREQYIKAERAAGFHPDMQQDNPNYMTSLATNEFKRYGVSGKTENIKSS